jgi:hypothetical protein
VHAADQYTSRVYGVQMVAMGTVIAAHEQLKMLRLSYMQHMNTYIVYCMQPNECYARAALLLHLMHTACIIDVSHALCTHHTITLRTACTM